MSLANLPKAVIDAMPSFVLYPDNVLSARAVYAASQTNVTIIAGIAGRKLVIVACDAMVDEDNTLDTAVLIGIAAATTPTASQVALTHPGLPAGSGVMRSLGGAPLLTGTAGHPLLITSSDPGGTLEVLVTYWVK